MNYFILFLSCQAVVGQFSGLHLTPELDIAQSLGCTLSATLNAFIYGVRQLSSSCQGVVRQLSGCLQAVIGQLSGSCQTVVVWLMSGTCQVVFRQLSGSPQKSATEVKLN